MTPLRAVSDSSRFRALILVAGSIVAVGCSSVAVQADAGADDGTSRDTVAVDVSAFDGPSGDAMDLSSPDDGTEPDVTERDATEPDATAPDATMSCAACSLAGVWTLLDRRNASGTTTRYSVMLNDDGTALRDDGLAARWSTFVASGACTFVLTDCTMTGPTNCVEYSATLDATACGGAIEGSVLGWMGPPSGTFTMTRP